MDKILVDDAIVIAMIIGWIATILAIGYRAGILQSNLVDKINAAKQSGIEQNNILDKKLDNINYKIQTIESVIGHNQKMTSTTNNAQINQLKGENKLIKQQILDIQRWLEKNGFKIRRIKDDDTVY